jgi:pilus assembly protein Flp/PilA
MNTISRFAADESGATAIEYGLIAALIAAVIVTAVGAIGKQLNTTFNDINDKIKAPPAA